MNKYTYVLFKRLCDGDLIKLSPEELYYYLEQKEDFNSTQFKNLVLKLLPIFQTHFLCLLTEEEIIEHFPGEPELVKHIENSLILFRSCFQIITNRSL